jgi:hypothetical protein
MNLSDLLSLDSNCDADTEAWIGSLDKRRLDAFVTLLGREISQMNKPGYSTAWDELSRWATANGCPETESLPYVWTKGHPH